MKYYPPRFLFRRYEILRRVKKAKEFLEIGPGNLDLAQDLLSKFQCGTLIDFNTSDVQQIYAELPDSTKHKLTLIIADFLQHDGFEHMFDCVVACEVMEHIRDDLVFLSRMNTLMIPSGQLILSVPARKKYWSRHDEIVGHVRRYEKQELHQKLSQAGFSQIEIISYGFPFQNLARLGRLALARAQYKERMGWDQQKQTQQSALIVRKGSLINLVGLVLNKYTIFPLNLFCSLFNGFDLAEGYVVSATKPGA